MTLLIPRRRLLVSLIFVFCACLVAALGVGRMSRAAGQTTEISGFTSDAPLRNIVPDNHANIKFVDGGRIRGTGSGERNASDFSKAKPLTLASGDLNADGFPDLVCGYARAGGGFLVIYFGDERAFAPTNPADIEAATNNRFRSPFRESMVIDLDHAPDFLSVGDFDRDSRRDIITAAHGGLSLKLLLNTDAGFASNDLPLPGQLTSMVVSEAYSPDGYADVYAGIAGGQLVSFDRTESLLGQKPTVYSLPGSPDSITVGRFDNGTDADFAVVVEGQLFVVHGGSKTTTERIDLPFAVTSVTAGDFIWDRDSRMELAVAASDGSTNIVSRGSLDTRRLTAGEVNGRRQIVADIRDGKRPASTLSNRSEAKPGPWMIAEQTSAKAGISRTGSSTLIPILTSGQQSVDLLAFDSAARSLSISYRTDGLSMDPTSVRRESVSFAIDRAPIAVLPMRLNIHSQASLVVFEEGSIEPSLIFFAPEATISVTGAPDVIDAAATCGGVTTANIPGPNGVTSLREAVCAANNTAGADTITFAAAVNGVPLQLTRVGDDNTSNNGDLDVNSDITFTGNGTANTIIQGSSSATFTGNMGDKAFGINQAGLLTAQNVAFSNLTIRFTRNDIAVNGNFTQTGGAMDIFLTGTGAAPGPTTTLTGVTFDSNANAHSYGGALNVDSGDLAASTNIFRGTVQITGSTFSNNDTLTTVVTDNPPTGGGINLFADVDNVTISSSTINANQTSADSRANGGGINIRHSNGGIVTINSNTAITNNIAGSDGGGILTAINQTFAMTGGSITGNTAQGTGDSANGGGFVNGNNVGTSTLTTVTISNNIATAGTAGTGGGVSDGANTALSINNCTITGNSADNGGGIAVTASGVSQSMNISNGTSITGNTATALGAAAHISGGGATLANTTTISGNVEVATGTLSALASSTTNLTGNLNMSAGAINGNNGAFNITGNYSQSGGTFTGNTSTFGVTGSFTESGGGFTNTSGTFTVGAGSTLSAGTFNAAGTFSVTGSHLQSGGTFNGGSGTLTLLGTGNFTQSSGTFTGGAVTVNLVGNFAFTSGTFNAGTSTFNFNGSAAQSVSNSSLITFSNLSDANVSQPLTFNNSVSFAGSLTANGANTILSPVAAAVIGGSGTLTGTGTARVTRATGTNDFLTQYTITNKTLTNLLIDYVGPGAQGISGAAYTNVRLNNSGGGTLSAAASVNGTLTIALGAFNVGTNTLTLNNFISVTGGSLTSGVTGTVIYNQGTNGQQVVAGQYGNLTFSNLNKTLPATGTVFIAGTFTTGASTGHTTTGSSIEFNGAGSQTIPAFNYNNLSSSGAGARTLSTLGTIGIAGNLMPGTNAYTVIGSMIAFNGSVLETVTGAAPLVTLNNVTVDNPAGVSLGINVTVNGVLTLTNGEVSTVGSNVLTLGTTGTVTRTAGFVTGTLRKNFAAPGPAFTLPVGTAGAYSPLNVTVTLGSGQLTAKANTGVPTVLVPNTARTLQRYWTLSGSGIRSNITFNYLDADVPGAPNNENIWNIIRVTGTIAVRYPPTLPYVSMNPAGNQFTISGLDSYSDWTAGEPLAPTAANAIVSGQVRTPDGRGISGAAVSMQDQQGHIQVARTNSFGYFRFDDVQAGQTYLVSVAHQRFTFATRTISVNDNVTGFDFTPEE